MIYPNDRSPSCALIRGITAVFLSDLLVCSLSSARAERVLEHYDVDSLSALATLIVKAEVGLPERVSTSDGECAIWDAKVISRLYGDKVEPGTVLRVVGIEEYRKSPGVVPVDAGFPELSGGDVVYLFLAPKDAPGGYAKYRLTDAEWKVIPSGLRLVSGKNVHAFRQYLPTGGNFSLGYVAMTPEVFVLPKGEERKSIRHFQSPWEKFVGEVPVWTVEAFERKVAASLKFVADLRRKMSEGRLAAEEREEILKSREEVLNREWATDDHIPDLLGE